MPSKKTKLADEKSNAYHATDMVAASRVAGAISRAEQGIASDVKALLRAFQYRGGFATEEEAKRYLDKPLTAQGRKMLMTKAAKLPAKLAKKYLTRLGSASTKAAISHKEAMGMVIDMNKPALEQAIRGQADPFLKKTITEAYGRQSFEIQKGMNIAFNTDMPTTGAISAIATKALPKSTTTSMANQVTEEIRAQIIEMMLQGKSTFDIAEKVAAGTGTEVWKAKRLVRTIITEASAEAEAKALDDAGFDEYEFIATKDERTCPVCGKLDGKVFKIDSKQVGKNCPPIHPNCRCTIGTVMEDWEKEDQVKAAKDEEGKNITIPASWTYEDWAKQYYPKGYKVSKEVKLKPAPKTTAKMVDVGMTAPNPPTVGKMTAQAPEVPESTAEPVKVQSTYAKPSIESLREALDSVESKLEERFADSGKIKSIRNSLMNKRNVLRFMEDPEEFVKKYESSDEVKKSKIKDIARFLFSDETPRVLDEESEYETEPNADYSKWTDIGTSFEESLTENERDAIYEFTSSDYSEINDVMRGSEDVYGEIYLYESKNIGKALDKSVMPAFASYRGVKDPSFMLGMRVEDLQVGDTFFVPEFMSTSTDLGVARDFADLSLTSTYEDADRSGKVLRIEAPATKGVAAPIKSISEYPDENEILLNRNTLFQFAGTEEINWKDEKMTIYRLKIIG